MTRLVAIDPGLDGCGLAEFDADTQYLGRAGITSELRRARYIENPHRYRGAAPMDAVLDMVDALCRVTNAVDAVAVERMQIYGVGKSKGDPNKLTPLIGIVCGFAAAKDAAGTWYMPHDWKGSIPKDEHGKRILARLSTFERAHIEDAGSKTHNIVDAIGIGLHHLGRLGRQRVIAR